MSPDRVAEHRPELGHDLALVGGHALINRKLPIGLGGDGAVTPEEERARLELGHTRKNRTITRRVEERQVVAECVQVEIAWQIRSAQKGLDFRAEIQAVP